MLIKRVGILRQPSLIISAGLHGVSSYRLIAAIPTPHSRISGFELASKKTVAHSSSTVLSIGRRRPPLSLLLVALFSLLSSSSAASQRVLVLPAGPIDSLPTFQINSTSAPSIKEGPLTPLRLQDGSRATYTDLLVMPGGDLLLAGGAGRGLVFFDPAGHELNTLFEPGHMIGPASVVISQFLGPNTPEILLFGDDSLGRVQTYDIIDRSYRGAFFFTAGTDRAMIARAIRLPADQIATAVYWPTLGASALEVWDLDDSQDPRLTIHSAPMERRPADQLDPHLHPLRDVMGHIDGRLLVTSRDRVAILDHDGSPLWELDLDDLDAAGAEFQSARFLDSDLIIIATRHPGVWTSPHINHALYLVDPHREEPLLARHAPLSRAPLRLELKDGHGGTGTYGFFADAFEEPSVDPQALRLDDEPRLTPSTFALDEATVLEFSLTNDSEDPLLLRRTELRFRPGQCSSAAPAEGPQHLWWARPARTLDPAQTWAERAGLSMTNMNPGTWCAQLSTTLRDGSRHLLDPPLDFEVLPPAQGPSEPVEIEELADFHKDSADDAPDRTPHDEALDQGCACTGSPTGSPPLFALLLLAALLARRKTQLFWR